MIVGGQDVFAGALAVGAWNTGVFGSDIAATGIDGGSPLASMLDIDTAARYTAAIESAPAGVSGFWNVADAALTLTADSAGSYQIPVQVFEDGADIGAFEIQWWAAVDASIDGVASITLDGDTIAAAAGVAIDGDAAVVLEGDAVHGKEYSPSSVVEYSKTGSIQFRYRF